MNRRALDRRALLDAADGHCKALIAEFECWRDCDRVSLNWECGPDLSDMATPDPPAFQIEFAGHAKHAVAKTLDESRLLGNADSLKMNSVNGRVNGTE